MTPRKINYLENNMYDFEVHLQQIKIQKAIKKPWPHVTSVTQKSATSPTIRDSKKYYIFVDIWTSKKAPKGVLIQR